MYANIRIAFDHDAVTHFLSAQPSQSPTTKQWHVVESEHSNPYATAVVDVKLPEGIEFVFNGNDYDVTFIRLPNGKLVAAEQSMFAQYTRDKLSLMVFITQGYGFKPICLGRVLLPQSCTDNYVVPLRIIEEIDGETVVIESTEVHKIVGVPTWNNKPIWLPAKQ